MNNIKLRYTLVTAVVLVNIINPGITWGTPTGDLFPTSNGTYQTGTPTPSTAPHWLVLNDSGNCDAYNDYITPTSTLSESEYFNLNSIPDSSHIIQINAIPCAESLIGDQALQLFYRLQANGQSYAIENDFSSTTTISTTKQEYARSYKSWASGNEPIKTSTSTLEIGFFMPDAQSPAGSMRVHQMRVVIEYE